MKKGTLSILSAVLGMTVGIVGTKTIEAKVVDKDTNKYKELSEKHFVILKLFNQWMITKQEGKSIVNYLHNENIKTVAIYGMSYVGERLYNELKGSDIEVKYAIDKNADAIYSELEIITPEDILEEVDAVLVTAVFYFDHIEDVLSEKMMCPILSLEDILYNL